jgi:DNA-binding IclR family transcriptional regulator
MELAILILLGQHETLAFDQIVVQAGAPPSEVRSALTGLHEAGLVDFLSTWELKGHSMHSASSWRLTDAGRAELARWR